MSFWEFLKRLIPFYGGYLQKKDASDRRGETEPYSGFLSNVEAAFGSAENKYLGTGLTEAEREANAFTAEREDIAWQRQMEADNTLYQRRVADMQAAGLNPMLAVSGGVTSAPSAHAGSSVSPAGGNLGDLINLFTRLPLLKAQIAQTEAETKKTEAESSKITSETSGITLDNEFKSRSLDARVESQSIANSLDRNRIRQIDAKIDELTASARHHYASAETEAAKKETEETIQILNRATAYKIQEMLPYEKLLASAQTDAQKASAALSFANAAYQNGLIDAGYIDALFKSVSASAKDTETHQALQQLQVNMKSGNFHKNNQSEALDGSVIGAVAYLGDVFVAGLSNLVGVIAPFK